MWAQVGVLPVPLVCMPYGIMAASGRTGYRSAAVIVYRFYLVVLLAGFRRPLSLHFRHREVPLGVAGV